NLIYKKSGLVMHHKTNTDIYLVKYKARLYYLDKRSIAGNISTNQKRLDRFCALIGMDTFNICHMLDHTIFKQNPITTEHVTSFSGDTASGPGVVIFSQRSLGRLQFPGCLKIGHVHHLQLHRDQLGSHPSEPFLNHLVFSQVFAELLTLRRIGHCRFKCCGGVSKCGPSNPDTGRVEYLRHFAEGLYTLHQRIGTNVDVVIINIGLVYSAQRSLMSDRRTGISFRLLWHDKPTHLAVVVGTFVMHTSEGYGYPTG